MDSSAVKGVEVMTRENLIQAIYENKDEWSCAYSCQYTMEEENPKDVCMKCAERLLTEYEQKIRADVIDDISNEIDRLNSQGGGIDDLKIFLEQLKELK